MPKAPSTRVIMGPEVRVGELVPQNPEGWCSSRGRLREQGAAPGPSPSRCPASRHCPPCPSAGTRPSASSKKLWTSTESGSSRSHPCHDLQGTTWNSAAITGEPLPSLVTPLLLSRPTPTRTQVGVRPDPSRAVPPPQDKGPLASHQRRWHDSLQRLATVKPYPALWHQARWCGRRLVHRQRAWRVVWDGSSILALLCTLSL